MQIREKVSPNHGGKKFKNIVGIAILTRAEDHVEPEDTPKKRKVHF